MHPDIMRDVELCEVMFHELLPTLISAPHHPRDVCRQREEGYGGKFDLVAQSGGKRTLFDIKTSKQVYDILQMGGHSAALKSNGIVVEQGAIIALHYKPENNPTLRGMSPGSAGTTLTDTTRIYRTRSTIQSEHRDDDFVANCRYREERG